MDSVTVAGMRANAVPIARFHMGETEKIFDEVQAAGTKIVMRNERPACVLVSPSQYESLLAMLSDYSLLMEADRRMAENHDTENISHAEMMRILGITQSELDDIDVEIE